MGSPFFLVRGGKHSSSSTSLKCWDPWDWPRSTSKLFSEVRRLLDILAPSSCGRFLLTLPVYNWWTWHSRWWLEIGLFDEMIIQGMKVARRESSYQTKSSVWNNMHRPKKLYKIECWQHTVNKPQTSWKLGSPKSLVQLLTFKVTPPARGPGGVRHSDVSIERCFKEKSGGRGWMVKLSNGIKWSVHHVHLWSIGLQLQTHFRFLEPSSFPSVCLLCELLGLLLVPHLAFVEHASKFSQTTGAMRSKKRRMAPILEIDCPTLPWQKAVLLEALPQLPLAKNTNMLEKKSSAICRRGVPITISFGSRALWARASYAGHGLKTLQQISIADLVHSTYEM